MGHKTYISLPNGSLESWKLNFIQSLPIQGYNYILVLIFMFSHFVEAFLCWNATAYQKNKVCYKELFPGAFLQNCTVTWNLLQCTALKSVCRVWTSGQHLLCAYHSQSLGPAGWTNGTIQSNGQRQRLLSVLGWKLSHLFLLKQPVGIYRVPEGLNEPSLLKGDIIHYCSRLMEMTIKNSWLLTKCLHHGLLGDKLEWKLWLVEKKPHCWLPPGSDGEGRVRHWNPLTAAALEEPQTPPSPPGVHPHSTFSSWGPSALHEGWMTPSLTAPSNKGHGDKTQNPNLKFFEKV